MTLVFTNSYDGTTDLLIGRLRNRDSIFRFNLDLFALYEVKMTADDFSITDPMGRQATQASVKKAYFRKPHLARHDSHESDFIEREQWTAFRAIVGTVWEDGKLVLVEPFSEGCRHNKIRQLRVAQRFFQTPETVFTNQPHLAGNGGRIAKTLSDGFMGDGYFFTSKVNLEELKIGIPWYIQNQIDAPRDVTVVFVSDECFAFSLDRSLLPKDTLDYKSEKELWDCWQPYDLPFGFAEKIQEYMRQLKLRFGRLDFLENREGNLIFLEVNPNGQFAWLDPKDKTGLLSRIGREIDSDSDLFSPVRF